MVAVADTSDVSTRERCLRLPAAERGAELWVVAVGADRLKPLHEVGSDQRVDDDLSASLPAELAGAAVPAGAHGPGDRAQTEGDPLALVSACRTAEVGAALRARHVGRVLGELLLRGEIPHRYVHGGAASEVGVGEAAAGLADGDACERGHQLACFALVLGVLALVLLGGALDG